MVERRTVIIQLVLLGVKLDSLPELKAALLCVRGGVVTTVVAGGPTPTAFLIATEAV